MSLFVSMPATSTIIVRQCLQANSVALQSASSYDARDAVRWRMQFGRLPRLWMWRGVSENRSKRGFERKRGPPSSQAPKNGPGTWVQTHFWNVFNLLNTLGI